MPATAKASKSSAPDKSSSPKTAASAKASSSKEKTIKYSDKSAGQPELVPIFEKIKTIMKPYVKGTIVEQGGEGGAYGLLSKKQVEVKGIKKDEVYFAGLLVQKGYVGFYFTPVYAEPSLTKVIKPELLKCLKGKSCFHIKKDDPEILGQIKDALKAGYASFEEKGWV